MGEQSDNPTVEQSGSPTARSGWAETSAHAAQPFAHGGTSRRGFLGAGAGLFAGGAAAHMWPGGAWAQAPGATDPDAQLRAVRGQRRILLKGGVVLTLDPAVGDFAQADVLIEDGKIREVRPNIPVGPDAAAIVDAANMVVLPGFVDTHHHCYQTVVRNVLANGLLDPDYRRDIVAVLTPGYAAEDAYAGVLLSALSALDQGHHHGGGHVAGDPHARARRRLRSGVSGSGHPRAVRVLAGGWPRGTIPGGSAAPAAHVLLVDRPTPDARPGRDARAGAVRVRPAGRRADGLARRQRRDRAGAVRARA